ncbi:MAG: hypothetical protein ACLP53_33790 [Isosphaeraceae bacterium]
MLSRSLENVPEFPIDGLEGFNVLIDFCLLSDQCGSEGDPPTGIAVRQYLTLQDMLEEMLQGSKVLIALDLLPGKLDLIIHLGDQEVHDEAKRQSE